MKAGLQRKPHWIRTTWQRTPEAKRIRASLRDLGLHTVCEESSCPNRGECYNRGTCTFLIMGSICTRNCRFCGVTSGRPHELDHDEPEHIARSILELGIRYAVITSVDRDDLPDFGADHFTCTIEAIRRTCPDVGVEVLTPDFQGSTDSLRQVLEARPDVFAHNLETVRRLTPTVRDRRAGYDLSLEVLRQASRIAPGIPVKTGLMAGLGETDAEILEAMSEARQCGAISITIGQYLSPTNWHLTVERFITPELFRYYADEAVKLGFKHVASNPLVRSSLSGRRAICRSELPLNHL